MEIESMVQNSALIRAREGKSPPFLLSAEFMWSHRKTYFLSCCRLCLDVIGQQICIICHLMLTLSDQTTLEWPEDSDFLTQLGFVRTTAEGLSGWFFKKIISLCASSIIIPIKPEQRASHSEIRRIFKNFFFFSGEKYVHLNVQFPLSW